MEPGSVRTTCPYCGVGCGVIASPRSDGGVAIAGDPDHPANYGRLCSKGSALGETLSLDDRLLAPLIGGQAASWDDALDLVAGTFRQTVAEHGPDSVALYVSGQILTEDYYVANKLMKGFVGSANIDTNSRLCMASSVAGHKRAFGADTVPGTYEDLECADLVVLVGSNLAWCHPVLYQRLAAARGARGTRVVVIDPRSTATCEIADLHLPIAPGTDVALFNGLLSHIATTTQLARDWVDAHTTGLVDALAAARGATLTEIADVTGLAPRLIADFYELFIATERVVTVYSQGVNQASAGTDKVNAIINCHLATARIGKPGMGPFSVTGQPNAMGGREVGGLANMLAAHMELGNAEHRRIVQTFWSSPTIADKPGLKAVDLFQAVADGRIKALWIMSTNPVDSLPDADVVRRALQACPFVVVSDILRHTDTTGCAHVLLPATAWGEKSGTVTNSERRISRQRSFLSAPGEAKPDWWQICEVARRMGFAEGFDYAGPRDIYAEYAALTGVENAGSRDLDICAHGEITTADYEALPPFQWPLRQGSQPGETRFFADGGFYHPDRKAKFVPTPYTAPKDAVSAKYPLVLNTGRLRDQWHTMTRTAKSPRLMAHAPEPRLEVHPIDARRCGLSAGDIVEVTSPRGRVLLRCEITDTQRAGTVFAPMHWTEQFAKASRTNVVVAAHTDPVSGQPGLKYTAVNVRPFRATWHGLLLSNRQIVVDVADYTATARVAGGFVTEMAASEAPKAWDGLLDRIIGPPEDSNDDLAYHDASAGRYRFARYSGDQLVAALFVAPTGLPISRSWATEQLTRRFDGPERMRFLAGRSGAGQIDRGPIVCACFEVGRNEIVRAAAEGCRTVADVGARLKAGTNCGSCRAEIRRTIDATGLAQTG